MAHCKKRNNEHTQKWLTLNTLLNDINDEQLIDQCTNEISEWLGGSKQLLHFLTNNANQIQLESMFEIIKKAKLHADEKTDNKAVNPTSYFLLIADEIISSNICIYLNREDILSFKQTSKQIGIECLKYQTRFWINVFDTNQLFHKKEPLNESFPRKTSYSGNQKVYTLFEISNSKDQLIFCYHNTPHFGGFLRLFDLTSNSNSSIHALTRNQRDFVVINTKKLVLMNNQNARKFNFKTDIENIVANNYNLMVLEYYDIFNTQFNIAQIILFNGNIDIFTLTDYIENNFSYFDEMDNNWDLQLKHHLKNMDNDPSHTKLSVYKHTGRNKMRLIFNHDTPINDVRYSFFTFQLNLDHKYVNLRNEYFLNAKQFCIDGMRYNAEYIVNIYNDPKYICPFYNRNEEESKDNNSIQISFKYKRNFKMYEFVENMLFSVKDNNKYNDLTSKVVKKKWVIGTELLNRTSPVKGDFIEYIDPNRSHQHKGKIIKINQHKIMLKDVKDGGYFSYSLNQVLLYLPERKSINDYRNKLNDEMFYVIKEGLITDDNFGDAYKINHQKIYINDDKNTKRFCIFVFPKMKVNVSQNKVKLRINFALGTEFNCGKSLEDINNTKYVGFPLIIWINKNDTLEEIINKYVNKEVITHIKCVFSILVSNKRIKSIPKSQRDSYTPWYELILPDLMGNDFLVITFKQSIWSSDVFTLQKYPEWIHKGCD